MPGVITGYKIIYTLISELLGFVIILTYKLFQ